MVDSKPPQTSTERGRTFRKNQRADGMVPAHPTYWVHKTRLPEARKAIHDVMHSRDWSVPTTEK